MNLLKGDNLFFVKPPFALAVTVPQLNYTSTIGVAVNSPFFFCLGASVLADVRVTISY